MNTGNNLFVSTVGICCLLILPGASRAGIIMQDQADAAVTFAFGGTYAQSFTAVEPQIASIGFGMADENTSLGNLVFTVTLYSGQGFGGSVLGTSTRTLTSLPALTSWVPNFIDFSFNAVTVVPGNIYTAKIASASGRGEVLAEAQHGDFYPGGYSYGFGVPWGQDLTFRIMSVPEPTSAMLLSGFSMLFVCARKHSRGEL